MITYIIPFAVLWTLCTSDRNSNYNRYFGYNVTRTTPAGIEAYRAALTLDWLAAEDSRQREMVAAIEAEPAPLSRVSHSDCIAYARPSSGTVARLMLEMLKNLEGDEGRIVPNLIQALVRSKLLALETSMFDNEPDLEALVKTPSVMMGEPHITFPRILATLWMAVTDPTTVKKHGWCTVNKMTSYLAVSKPSDVAKHMRVVEPIIARARFIMEEFIQHVTPLKMLQKPTNLASQPSLARPHRQYQQKGPPPKIGAPLPVQRFEPQPFHLNQNSLNIKRPVRTEPETLKLVAPTRKRVLSSTTTQSSQTPADDDDDPRDAPASDNRMSLEKMSSLDESQDMDLEPPLGLMSDSQTAVKACKYLVASFLLVL